MIRYKDFVTGKQHFTRGNPEGVMTDGLGIEQLVVQRKSDRLFIPSWYLDPKGRMLAESVRQETKKT
jgi:hypothetical protein